MDILKVKADQLTQYESRLSMPYPLYVHIWKKMDIGKGKVDQPTLLSCLPYTLSLVSNLEVKAPKIYAELFGNFIFYNINSKLNGKNIWNPGETVSSVGTGKQFYFLFRLAITPYYP